MDEEIKYLKKYLPQDKWNMALKRLENNEPVQYIIGNVNFYGSLIKVDPRVLIPRFETEGLVEKTIEYALANFKNKIKIIDLGTGSGCIAISLKKHLSCDVDALDISKDALVLAKENAKLNNVYINFYESNIEEEIKGKYDIIISNPPYIPFDGYVSKIVKDNEPNIALFALDQGLYYYKKILSYAFKHLNPKGIIAFEIGDNQKELLINYIKENYNIKYEFFKDLAGLDRYLFIYNE